MNNISKIIVEAIEQKKYKDIDNGLRCCLCGCTESQSMKLRKDILSKSFNGYVDMKNRVSEYICNYCETLLNDNYMKSPKGNRCGLRLYSFIVENNQFKIIDMRQKIYYLFEHEFKLPFLLCFSATGKKHIFYKSKLSYGINTFFVCTEDNNIFFDRHKYKYIYEKINKFFQLGVTKDELKTCIIDPKKINKYQLNFNDIYLIKKYKNDQCYQLIIDCLMKEKKEDDRND